MGEHRQRLTTGERYGGGEHGVEAGVAGRSGDGLGCRVVVPHKVGLIDAEVGAHGRVGQVKNLEGDVSPTDASPDFEGVDAAVDEMAEQLGPCSLLLTRSVPDARVAGPVVAARAIRWIRTGRERVSGWALVPEGAGDLSTRCGCYRLGKVHT